MIKAMAKEIKEYDLVLIITDTLHALMYGLFDEIEPMPLLHYPI